MRKIFLAVLATVLVGCATPYQPFALFGRGGYTEQKLSEDTYVVTYYGNGATNMQTLNTLLLYRTAEITLDQGYDYFVVMGGEGRIPNSFHGGFKSVEHTVKLYKGTPSNTAYQIYVAKKVKADFGPYISQQK